LLREGIRADEEAAVSAEGLAGGEGRLVRTEPQNYRQSFRLRLVPKANPCFTRRVMVEFVDKHREIISE
jgi:hypothetical protein